MQDDPFPAAERILADIETVFKKDPELREFDIIPVTLNQNKSPVHHVEHCLGLESWCVRHVYCYTYHRLMDARQQRHRRTEPSTLSRLLLGALLLNPDVQTFWNMRRELVQAGRLNICSELHFTAVVLSRKPKSAEAFAHRKWLLGRLLAASPDVEAMLDEELRVTQYAADHYANNYHAWHHRMWCLTQLVPATSHLFESYLGEWAASESWISVHVSDHSGLQYRQFLLKQLCMLVLMPANKSSTAAALESARKSLHQYLHPVQAVQPGSRQGGNTVCEGASCKVFNHSSFKVANNDYHIYMDQCTNSSLVISLGLIISELLLNTDLILRYTGHEALWYHRRFSLCMLKSMLRSVRDGIWNRGNGNSTTANKNELEINHCSDKIGNDCKLPLQCSQISRRIEIEIHRNKIENNSHPVGFLADCKRGQAHYLLEDCANAEIVGNHVHKNIDGTPLEKDQKLTESDYSEEEDEIRHLVSKAVLLHEDQLLAKCEDHDTNQQRLMTQHYQWLSNVLGLQAHKPGQ